MADDRYASVDLSKLSASQSTGEVNQLGNLPGQRSTPSSRPPAPPSGTGRGSGNTPFTYEISPFQPADTFTGVVEETTEGLNGLKNALFGLYDADTAGQHGGLLGDVPILGGLGRGASQLLGGAGDVVGGVVTGALDIAGGVMEHIDLSSEEDKANNKVMFEQLPDTFAGKAEAVAAMAEDPGAANHYMAKAINDYNREMMSRGEMVGKPDFFTNSFRQTGSAAEAFDNVLAAFGLLPRLGERVWTEVGTPGQGGMDRLEIIKAVGDGQTAFAEDKGILGTGILAGDPTSGLNPIEAIVYEKTRTGEWTDDEARDFLAANNAGFSHSAIANLGGSLALDPMVFAGIGAGLATKFGKVGAKLVRGIEVATKEVEQTNAAIRAVETMYSRGLLLDTERAEQLAPLAAKLAEDKKALDVALNGAYKVGGGGDVSKVNLLAQAAHSEKMTGLVRNIYKVYEPMQKYHIDKMLKIGRGLIDPLGVITLKNPFRKQMLHLVGDDAMKTVIGAYGDSNHARLLHRMTDVIPGENAGLANEFGEGLAVYSVNLTRRTIARVQRDNALASGTAGRIMQENINEVVARLGEKVPRSFQEHILLEANDFRRYVWDESAYRNLGYRMEQSFGVKDADEWIAWLKEGLTEDELGLLHAATYGIEVKRLLTAVRKAELAGGVTGNLAGKLQRLILINRNTLTNEGAMGVVNSIKAGADDAEKYAIIEAAQVRYPELRSFVLDPTDKVRSVEVFTDELQRRAPALVHQVIDTELAGLPEELRRLHTDETFTLGLAPEDEFKWGLQRSNAAGGNWAPTSDVWVDHVAPGPTALYRPVGHQIETNILGQPIIGGVGKALARATDHIDAGVKTMGRRITGTLIANSARNRFIQKAAAEYADEGITEKVASDIMQRFHDAIELQDIVVRPSGFSNKQMWDIAKAAIPPNVSQSRFGRRELMALILDAYQGDLRHIGVTQAFSSRVKRVLSFSGNNASVMAEQAYPLLKYRLNVIFQAMEKVEPWILNSLRGITPARSVRSMNDADKATAVLLERMAQRSLVSNADQEMAEYAGRMLHGENIMARAARADNPLGKITQKFGVDWDALRDVKGVKQVNMLRTFRNGLGKEIRSQWEQVEPGLFDRMYEEAVRKAQKGVGGLTEDEFAVSILAEQMLGNNVMINPSLSGRVEAIARQFDKVDYRAAIVPGEWMSPQTLGELRPLGLDDLAEFMAWDVGAGKVTKTRGDILEALNNGSLKMDDIKQALRRLNADPDYIARVQHSLEFSWTGFWRQVKADYNLTDKQVAYYQDLWANAAEVKGMDPIDYMSQIVSPSIASGDTRALSGHLGRIIDITEGGGPIQINRVKSSGYDATKHQTGTAAEQAIHRAALNQAIRDIRNPSDPAAPLWSTHMTNDAGLQGILDSGAVREGSHWADRDIVRPVGTAGAPNPKYILRTKMYHPSMGTRQNAQLSGSVRNSAAIPITDIEYLRKDGTWAPLSTAVTKTGETRSLGRFAVQEGGSGSEDLFVQQMAEIFSAHLEPSMKRALLADFQPELRWQLSDFYDLDMAEIDKLWTPEMNQMFAARVLGQINAPTTVWDSMEAGLLRTVEDFDRVDPRAATHIELPSGATVGTPVHGVIGPGLRTANPEVQRAVLTELGRVQKQLPSAQVRHIDIVDNLEDYLDFWDVADNTLGVTLSSSEGGDVILLNKKFYGDDHQAVWRDIRRRNQNFRDPVDPWTSPVVAGREVFVGAPEAVGGRMQDTVRHELGHVIHTRLMDQRAALKAAGKTNSAEYRRLNAYKKVVDRFEGSMAHYRLSAYAQTNTDEAMAELFALAVGDLDPWEIDRATRYWVDEFLMGRGPQSKSHGALSVFYNPLEIKGPQQLQDFVDQFMAVDQRYDAANFQPLFDLMDDYRSATKASQRKTVVKEMQEAAARIKSDWEYERVLAGLDLPGGGLANLTTPEALTKKTAQGGYTDVRDAVADLRRELIAMGEFKPATIRGPADVTAAERHAILEYQSGSQMGKYVQGVPDPTRDATHIQEMDALFQRAPLTNKNLTMYRGVGSRELDNIRDAYQRGRPFEADGYISTSYDDGIATGFGSGVLVKIEVPAGTRGIHVSDFGRAMGEEELLLPRGALFDVELDPISNTFTLRMRPRVDPILSENPEVLRATQQFAHWTESVLADGFRRGENAAHASTIEKIAGMPTHARSAFNATENDLMQTAITSMKDKWNDAFRLQYYARGRSMLERSVNHPMFGIYPASYMWGKILPEMIHFMSQEPFGIRTGAALSAYMNTVRNVALQREFDPEFDQKIESMGHSAAYFALGYLMPSWPWEASAGVAGWAREFSQQGLDIQSRVESGGTAATKASESGINLMQAAGKAADLLNPLRPIDRAIMAPIREFNAGDDDVKKSYFDTDQSVSATELGGPLEDALSDLSKLFGG